MLALTKRETWGQRTRRIPLSLSWIAMMSCFLIGLNLFRLNLKVMPHIVCCGTQRIEPNGEMEVMPKSLGKIFNDAIGKFTNGACYVIDRNLFFEAGGFDEDLTIESAYGVIFPPG